MNLQTRVLRVGLIGLAWILTTAPLLAAERKTGSAPLLMVVMDPLARDLACVCVKGYGQRDYRKLGAQLATSLKQRVSVEFSDDLAETLRVLGGNPEVLVIGDRSLVAQGAKKANLNCHPICELSDQEGNTTLTASFVARSDDSVRGLKEVTGRKLLIGLPDGDQKLDASLKSLREAGVEPPKPEKHLAYTDAALDLLDSDVSSLPIAVLPSYALVMLQGCGSVKPGNLKVIGKTEPVPFITAFLSDNIAGEKEQKILKALLAIKEDPQMLTALESKEGFKAVNAARPRAGADWPDWRGPNRDGRVPRLPARLSERPSIIWKKGTMHGSLAGITVANDRVILAERDFADEHDVYRCFNADNGELAWRISFAARGQLDYGNSPRAVPVINKNRAYLLSAFGDLRSVDLSDGKVIWHRNLPSDFAAALPTWGMCSPPLIVDDLLIVNPGATNASLVALDLETGRTRWKSPGLPAAYSAFIRAQFSGRTQIVGYDERSLGGWDAQSGKRLWQFAPPVEGDFNVPTPVAVNGGLLVATENNGTRFYQFDSGGQIIAKPSAQFPELSPDTASPVVSNGRVFGAKNGRLYCLDLKCGLKPVWESDEKDLGDHASFIADDERVLVVTLAGELILLDARAETCSVISRMRLFEDDVEVYSHPALVGTRLYARGGTSAICVDLGEN